MEVSTIEFFEAIKKLSPGHESEAKIIADYVEQTKQSNYSTLKDVFMVKSDKIDIIEYINKRIERQTYLLIVCMGIGFTIIGWLIKH